MDKNKIRVLHVVGQLEYGGISTWLKTLILSLDSGDAFRMDICCSYRGGAGPLFSIFQDLGYRIYHIPLGINPYSYVKKMRSLIKEGQYHIVHDHRSFLGGAALKAARDEGVAVRILFHHTPNDDRRAKGLRILYEAYMKYWALENSTEIWACSRAAMDAHYGKRTNSYLKSMRVIHSAVIPAKSMSDSRKRLRADFGIPADAKLIGFIGRITLAKNPFVALRVFAKIADTFPDAWLLVVGDGLLLPEMKAQAKASPVGSRTKFLGFRDDVADVLQSIDVLYQPSFFEGLPLITLEALHAGLSVVGSRAPGLLEALPIEMHKYCSDAEDVEGQFQALYNILKKPIIRVVPNAFLSNFTPFAFKNAVKHGYELAIKKNMHSLPCKICPG